MQTDDLLLKIEENRQRMVELGLAFSFIDERVVRISDQLDKLLNKYHAMSVKVERQ